MILSAKSAGMVRLGDFKVNRLGLGTNRIADNDQSRAVLKRAVELGVNYIDTAARYGQSEIIIGQSLAPYTGGTVVGTKGGWSNDNQPTNLEASINNSLRLLQIETLPLWQLHRVDQRVPIEQTMEFLKSQQQAGKIHHVGLSEVSVEQIEQARKIVPIASVQNEYSLVRRQHDDVLDYCTKQNIVFMPFYPLASGDVVHESKLNKLAAKYSASPIQIAIAWLLRRSPMMLPIPGTLSIEHLEANVAAASLELSSMDLEELNQL